MGVLFQVLFEHVPNALHAVVREEKLRVRGHYLHGDSAGDDAGVNFMQNTFYFF